MKKSRHGANVLYFAHKYGIKESEIIDFSSNINIFSPDINYNNIMQNIKENIDKYPDIDYINLKKSISKIYNISKDYIFLGNGATEVLGDILLLDRFCNIGICNPTFSEYERVSKIYKKNVINIDINKIEENYSDIRDIYIEKSSKTPDIIIICNPNNPTGIIYNLHNLLDYCKKNNIFLLVDETFIDFCDNERYSLKTYIKDYDNLIVISAITKYFAFASARLGYSFCSNNRLNNELEYIKKPWSINILAQSISYELEKVDYMFAKKTKKYFEEETTRLYEKYDALDDIYTIKSHSCYICLTFKKIDVKKLQEYLLKNYKSLVRILDNYKNIDNNSIRIAIKQKKQNDMLFEAIKKYINEGQ